MWRSSLSSPSQVPCHSSPSTQVTPVTKRSDSIVRRMAPLDGSTWWIRRSRCWPTHRLPSAQVRPESPPLPGAGIEPSTRPVAGSILSMRCSAICQRCLPSNAVPASALRSIRRVCWPLAGSMATSAGPVAAQMLWPSKLTPPTLFVSSNGPYSRTISAGRVAAWDFGGVIVESFDAPTWRDGSDSTQTAARRGVTRSS